MEFRLFKYTFKGTWINKFMEEKVLVISLLLAVFTSFISTPSLSYINFKVVFSLFNLMLVVSAFEELKLMDKAAVIILNRCKNLRLVSFVMIALTFFSSMLVTNDVALITFVPLTLVISKKVNINPMEIIIFQTLASNIGSSLTPMGNPQNLFLFTYYKLTAVQFFKLMIPFVMLGALLLTVLNLKIQQGEFKLKLDYVTVKDKGQALLLGVLFLAIILSIFNLITYLLAFILTVVTVLFMNKSLFKKVDFFLLATFICFFIFIGNLSHIGFVHRGLGYLLNSSNKTFFTSIILSQVLSNVPTSILVANFSNSWKEVLLGVNIGGLGTLIASLASLISYKLFVNNEGSEISSSYLSKFTFYNVIALLLFTIINFILLHFNAI